MYVHQIFKRYKLSIQEGKIFDPIRKKYVTNNPEETVRQKTIKFLIQRLGVPKAKINVEKSLHQLGDTGNNRRVDICIFDEQNVIVAIIECKAYYVGDQESPYIQALDYVTSLNVHNYFVVDGYEIMGFHYNEKLRQFEPYQQIPKYNELISMR